MKELEKQFNNPGAAYRGKPFWSWNGELKQDELLRQVEIMREMGMGGFFMHSRTGLITEYLGREWFELTNACAQAAEELGLEAWLYDEDRWPSGTAGGMVTQNPQYRSRFLSLRPTDGHEFLWHDDICAAFVCDLNGLTYTACERIHPDTPSTAYHDRTVLAFSIEEMEPSSFYNGFTYVDTMQRAATDEYLRLTHEAYKQHCGEHLGRSIKGIFTDEPHRGAVMAGFGISNANNLWMTPWTPDLPKYFQERFGTDLLEHLPELFLQPEGRAVSPIKWQYMELTQQLFLENYARPLFEWCQNNNLLLTGHALHEDNLTAQATMQGSLMRCYEFMHIPGVDVLTEGNRNYWLVKQLSSVARQLGQKWLLSELYGCTGWQMSFESHKAVGDWQALFGINVRCQHLAWYSMEGEAKRDFPASIFYQSAWWRDYQHIETYYARLGLMLSQGQPCCDVLVINPIESLWCQIHAGWVHGLSPQNEAVRALERGYEQLFFWLAGAHIDFDYGDEEMMSRLCRIENDDTGPLLCVGQAAYRTVIVGRMTTMRQSTLEILDQFAQAGGKVFFVGAPPAYVDALTSAAAAELSSRTQTLPWEEASLAAACRETLAPRVEILDATTGKPLGSVFCQLRDDGKSKYLVAMNTNTERTFKARIRVYHALHNVVEWNCLSGERYAISARAHEDFLEWTTDFPPSGERAYTLASTCSGDLPFQDKLREMRRESCAGPFAYVLHEENVCVLDVARFQIGAGPWQSESEVLKIDQAVRRAFALPLRSGEMVQPWYRNQSQPQTFINGKVRLAFEFFIEDLPQETVQLCVERPERGTFTLNGHTLDATPRGWWIDIAFERLNVPCKYLQQGANVLEWEIDFHDGINIEAMYLIGAFGVRLDGTRKTLTTLPKQLEATDIAAQGLPFYSGAITFKVPVSGAPAEGQKIFLEVPRWEAACLKVSSPGHAERLIAWQPYRAEITGDVRDGNAIDLELVLTRRNTFGPLHQVPLCAAAYGPGNFITEGDDFSPEYMLYPSGLLSAPEIVICAVETGAEESIDVS